MPRGRGWVKEHSLAIALFGAFGVFLLAQSLTGWVAHNEDLTDHARSSISYAAYLTTGHFVEATFENWESEFLQMAAYVVLTIWLVQRGSSESKPLEGDEELEADPRDARPRSDLPGPVRRGGWELRLYENSLGLVFAALFLASFALHALGGVHEYNLELMETRQRTDQPRPVPDDVDVLVPIVPELAERVLRRRSARDPFGVPAPTGFSGVETRCRAS